MIICICCGTKAHTERIKRTELPPRPFTLDSPCNTTELVFHFSSVMSPCTLLRCNFRSVKLRRCVHASMECRCGCNALLGTTHES